MNTLDFIKKRHNISGSEKSPIFLKHSRFKELPKLFRKLGFKVGVEIGVSTGFYSKVLCKYIPGLKLYCVDPWESYEDYVEYNSEEGKKVINNNLSIAKERLSQYDATFIRKYSMGAVKDFEDNSLDFVFIDGNHSFEYVINDISEWSKKVRPGGIIAGHDYWTSKSVDKLTLYTNHTKEHDALKLCQVQDAVDAWTKANKIYPWFVLNGDKCPSWFWVKE